MEASDALRRTNVKAWPARPYCGAPITRVRPSSDSASALPNPDPPELMVTMATCVQLAVAAAYAKTYTSSSAVVPTTARVPAPLMAQDVPKPSPAEPSLAYSSACCNHVPFVSTNTSTKPGNVEP